MRYIKKNELFMIIYFTSRLVFICTRSHTGHLAVLVLYICIMLGIASLCNICSMFLVRSPSAFCVAFISFIIRTARPPQDPGSQ